MFHSALPSDYAQKEIRLLGSGQISITTGELLVGENDA